MSLQNRIRPDGKLIASEYRGTLMGNRGVLHNTNKQIVKEYNSISWITCKLKYKNNHRTIMSPGKYTELFFLDEATSFAAGHRPCSLCRNREYKLFKMLWSKANNKRIHEKIDSIHRIDEIIDYERKDIKGNKKTYKDNIKNLPNGVIISVDNNPEKYYLVYNKLILEWSFDGYVCGFSRPLDENVTVLTPLSIVETFRMGYIPAIHPTAIEIIKMNSLLVN